MKLKRVIDYLKNTRSPLSRDPNVPDEETTDKQLRSLRRQRRVQMEEIEKQRLVKQIQDFNRRKDAFMIRGDDKKILKTKKSPKKKQEYLSRGGLL